MTDLNYSLLTEEEAKIICKRMLDRLTPEAIAELLLELDPDDLQDIIGRVS